MSELEQFFCSNEQCKDYGVRCQGNVAFRGKYGKDKSRGRELDDARRMLKDLTVRSQGKPLFVSDELPHYAAPGIRSGIRGRTKLSPCIRGRTKLSYRY